MALNFKASNIAKAESKTGKNFFKVIQEMAGVPSFSDLMFLFLAGGATEEEFDNAFGEGIEEAMLKITEGLNESGFLGQKVDTKELKEAISKKA